MSLGLDLSQGRFRSLRRRGEKLLARQCAAAYAILLDNPARRDLFHERRVPFAEFGMHLILFGDAAVEWSDRLSVTAIPLCLDGRHSFDDTILRHVVAALLEGLAPPSEVRPDDCCLALPGGRDAWNVHNTGFLAETLGDLGYRLRISSRSLAVALSELSAFGMSGLGIYLGAAGSELSIVRQGRELARIDLPCAGSFAEFNRPAAAGFDDQAAERIVAEMEESARLREFFAMAAFELQRRPEAKALVSPVALAVSGELVADPDLAMRLPDCVQHASWPFAVRTVRITSEPEWAVSRGCLIQAELERIAEATRAAA